MISRLRRDVFIVICVVTLALGTAGLLRAGYHLVQIPHQLDFTQFYMMSYMVRTGQGASLYSPEATKRLCESLSINPCNPTNYPPIAALVFLPLSYLPYRSAEAVYLLLNLAMTIALGVWGTKELQSCPNWKRWALIVFVALLPATTRSLLLGQINAALALLLVVTIVNADRRDWVAISALSLASAIKLWPLILSGFFLLRKQRRVAIGSLIGFGLLTSVGLLAIGPREAWEGYFASRLPQSGVNMIRSGESINQSIWGTATRAFIGGTTHVAQLSTEDNKEVPVQPFIRSETLYWLTTGVFSVLIVILLVWLAARPPYNVRLLEQKAFSAVTIGVIALLPFSWDHYAYHIIFPYIIVLADKNERDSSTLVLGIVCLLLLLVQRFSAYLPQHGLLLSFGFLAEVCMLAYLITSLMKAQNAYRDR